MINLIILISLLVIAYRVCVKLLERDLDSLESNFNRYRNARVAVEIAHMHKVFDRMPEIPELGFKVD